MPDSCLTCRWYDEETRECRAEPPQLVVVHDDTVGTPGSPGTPTWRYPVISAPSFCEHWRRATIDIPL